MSRSLFHPPPPPFQLQSRQLVPQFDQAVDAYGRTVSSGWGDADIGGPYVISGTAADYNVASGVGTISIAAAATRNARLPNVWMLEQDGIIEFEFDKVPTGASVFMDFVRRSMNTDHLKDSYWLELVTTVTPQFQLLILRRNFDGTSTALGTTLNHSLTPTAATRYKVRVQTTGTNPTTINAKLWVAASSEPGTWDRTETDSTAVLQGPGAVGLRTAVSSGVLNGPILFTYDNLNVQTAQAAGGPIIRTWTDAITQADAWARVGTFGRTWSDAATQADAWVRIATFPRTFTSATTQADAWTRVVTYGRTFAEAVTSSDAWTRTGTFLRALTSSVAQADVWTRVATLARTLTEAVGQSDAWTAAKIIARSWAEAVTSADAWTRTQTLTRTLTDAVTQSDAWTRSGTFLRALSESVAQVDGWIATKLGAIVRTWSEAVTSADSWTRTGTFARTLTEAVGQSDAWVAVRLIVRSFTSAVTSADVWTRSATLVRSMTHSVTQSDAWTRTATLVRSFTEAVSHSDVWTQISGALVTIGGYGPRIVGAFSAVVSGIAQALRPGGSASAPTPDGEATNPRPEND